LTEFTIYYRIGIGTIVNIEKQLQRGGGTKQGYWKYIKRQDRVLSCWRGEGGDILYTVCRIEIFGGYLPVVTIERD